MDDNADFLRVLLDLEGDRVDACYEGRAALEFVATNRPDAVLLDIGLPGVNGFEVARRLREDPGLVGVCRVAISGDVAEEDRRRSQAAGFDHPWVKLVDVKAVQGILGTPPALA